MFEEESISAIKNKAVESIFTIEEESEFEQSILTISSKLQESI